jgi:hypothetical protein
VVIVPNIKEIRRRAQSKKPIGLGGYHQHDKGGMVPGFPLRTALVIGVRRKEIRLRLRFGERDEY